MESFVIVYDPCSNTLWHRPSNFKCLDNPTSPLCHKSKSRAWKHVFGLQTSLLWNEDQSWDMSRIRRRGVHMYPQALKLCDLLLLQYAEPSATPCIRTANIKSVQSCSPIACLQLYVLYTTFLNTITADQRKGGWLFTELKFLFWDIMQI